MLKCRKTVVSLIAIIFSVVSFAQDKKEAVRIDPQEIEVELTRAEARIWGGEDLGRIMVMDGWDNRLRLTSVQTSANVSAAVYDLTHRFPNGAPEVEHGFRIDTRLKPTDRVGTLKEWVRVSTNHPDLPVVTIPITYHVLPEVQAIPRTVVVNRFLDRQSTKTVRLTTAARAGLEIREATPATAWLSVTPARIDANTIDLRVSLTEPSTGDILQSALTIRTVRPEVAEIVVPVVVLPQVGSDDPHLPAVIALSNRLNREVLSSFRCQYTSTFGLPGQREIHQTHRYGFAGDREYHQIEVAGTAHGALHYTRNGRQARLRSGGSPGVVLIGNRDTIKGSDDLFAAAAGAGGYVIANLDRLNTEYEKVVSLRESLADGDRRIVVAIEQRRAPPAKDGSRILLTIHFSVENGFLPVQIDDQLSEGSVQAGSSARHAKVTKVLKFEAQGGVFYLPAEFRETYSGGKLIDRTYSKVNEESIRINAALPQEDAWIAIRPDDTVVDAGLAPPSSRSPGQITIPGVRDFWGAKTSFQTPRGDVMEVKILFEQESAPAASRVGWYLPSLAEAGFDLASAAYRDKIVLLCFFDRAQRPSRHCVEVLANRADALQDQNMAVVLVQVTQGDGAVSAQGAEEQNLPWPIRTIRADAEKLRSAWGVPSLPWLILTDKEHVVRAEGFPVDELETRIQAEKARQKP